MNAKILIIDDEVQLRGLLARIIGLEGYEVIEAGDCRTGLKQLELLVPDVVLCDVRLPDGSGVEMVDKIKKRVPMAEVILLTAYGNIPDGVQAIKNGAFDYITKGDDNNKILPLLARAVEKVQMARRLQQLEAQVSERFSFDMVLGDSPAIREAVALARKVSATDATVLITGETGTGKEVFAQAIHRHGSRAKRSFVAVNCSAFSKELLESELFGHRAGSFTGAVKDKKGLFEEATGGTIFLDELGEMPFDLQAKLLRVLECGEFIKVGETKPTTVDVRVIAATNRDMPAQIKTGCFREDLYYRLSVFQIHLPPLRERPEDVEAYARMFVERFGAKAGRRMVSVEPDYFRLLRLHNWPGNVRELRNAVERSLIMAEGEVLRSADLPLEIQRLGSPVADGTTGFEDRTLDMASVERRHIQRVLQMTGGNKTRTAALLGIGVTTLYRKVEEYGL